MNIDANQAIQLLRDSVAGREDFIYKSPDGLTADDQGYHCEYAHDDCPGCLIGVALHKAGVTVDQLAKLPANYINNKDVKKKLAAFGCTMTDEAQEVFRGAQSRQDSGHTWGDALAYAERIFKEGQQA